jgi:hypothetical protein
MRHDRRAARRIRRSYLDYTKRAVAWYRAAGLELLCRRPAFVFLLHETRLNADCLAELAKILRANHLHPVSLDCAPTDPAYGIAETKLDTDGDEWISRWSPSLDKELAWEDFPEPPAYIAAANARLDKEP